MAVKYIDDQKPEFWKDTKVIARFDFNVPMKKGTIGQIKDTTRIDMAFETINYLLNMGVSKLILMSHLGRPTKGAEPQFSLEPVANYLAEKLSTEVILTEKAVDCGLKELIGLKSTKIVLLENLRFHPEEEDNEEEFAYKIASLGNVYVNDAFGAAHRKHASVHKITKFFPATHRLGGFLLKKEITALDKVLHHPQKPFISVIGGAKVADKIKTIEKLLVSVDHLLIGGAMAYPFLKAQGHNIGNSLCDDLDVKLAANLLSSTNGKKIKLPQDHVVAQKDFSQVNQTNNINIADEFLGFDIGEKTIQTYCDLIQTAKTVFWNGPMGYFEKELFAQGTNAIAKAMSESQAFTIVGGGDSVAAVNQSGYAQKMGHISTGGGASLEYIEKGELPGLQALKFGPLSN